MPQYKTGKSNDRPEMRAALARELERLNGHYEAVGGLIMLATPASRDGEEGYNIMTVLDSEESAMYNILHALMTTLADAHGPRAMLEITQMLPDIAERSGVMSKDNASALERYIHGKHSHSSLAEQLLEAIGVDTQLKTLGGEATVVPPEVLDKIKGLPGAEIVDESQFPESVREEIARFRRMFGDSVKVTGVSVPVEFDPRTWRIL